MPLFHCMYQNSDIYSWYNMFQLTMYEQCSCHQGLYYFDFIYGNPEFSDVPKHYGYSWLYVGFFINNGQQTLKEMPYHSIVFFVLYLNNPDRSMFL